MKNAYLVTGIRFGKLHRLLHRNKCSWTFKTVFRYLILLQNSFWSSFFYRRDLLKFGKQIREFPLPKDPIFIIGHWRTGSTYLHQLMNLDPALSAPTLYQTALPEGFITARPYYAPIMKQFIGKHRPFDNTKAGIDEPQECEFALFRMTGDSPMERLLFPLNEKYFLLQEEVTFNPGGDSALRWESALKDYYRKLAWYTGKRLLLKNPFHSMRLPVLKKIFPDARFIHIYRNPTAVVPSTIRMWTTVSSHNAMNHNGCPPKVEEVAGFYKTLLQEVHKELAGLPAQQQVAVSYEELVAQPVETLQRIYQSLDIPFSAAFENRLKQYLEQNRNYEKNTYQLSAQDTACIQDILKDTLPAYF